SRRRGSNSPTPESSATASSTTTWSVPWTSFRASWSGSLKPQVPSPVHDPSPHRRATRERGLALRAGHRRRQARAPDQQLPPPARRGYLRSVPASARGVTLEELLDDGPRGNSRGQDQVRVQVLVAGGSAIVIG